jgi:hypothetical protein
MRCILIEKTNQIEFETQIFSVTGPTMGQSNSIIGLF